MIPSYSGGSSAAGCNPISSNCVIWQGPDIPCIDLCKGDSISQVLAHLAEMMCSIQASPDAACCDVSLLDPQCLDDFYKREYGGDIPDDWVLQDYINLLIQYVCQLDTGGGTSFVLQNLPFPGCIRPDGISMNGTLLTQTTYNTGMPLYGSENTYIIQNDGSAEGNIFGGQFNGWAEMVVNALCNLVACCERSAGMPIAQDTSRPSQGEIRPTKSGIEKIVDNRFARLSSGLKYIPPKVVPTGVTNKVGRPVAMEFMLTALEREFVLLRGMTGTSLNLRDAIRSQCMNLNTAERLTTSGEIGNMTGWFRNPKNLAQSHSNQWALLCEVTNAVRDIKNNHLITTGCSDIQYGAKIRLNTSGGSPKGLNFTFEDTIVKAPYTDTDPRGCKITIKDASLNSVIKYVKISDYQETSRLFPVTFNQSALDTASNYEVTIDYSFSDGDSVCAKTEVHTVENSAACPNMTFNEIGGDTFKFHVTGIDVAAKYEVTVICETLTGGEVGRVHFSSPSNAISGTFRGLMGGQSYNVYTRLKTQSGNMTFCEKNVVKTLTPSCATEHISSSEYGSAIADLHGTAKLNLGCYNDGANTYSTVAGFDIDGKFKVVKCTDDTSASCDSGKEITTFGEFISSDASHSIVCSDKTYTSGFPQSQMGSGWQYVDSINGSVGVTYFVYALVNNITNTIDEVVACCDCKALYINTQNSMIYCKTGKTADVRISVAGFASASVTPSWSITTTPEYGNVYYDAGKSKDGEGCFTYTSTASGKWVSDSFRVKLTNSCGTSNEIIVPISRAREIPKRDGDITIFVDTCTMSYTDAVSIKETFEAVKTAAKVICPNWSGTINYVPVDSKGNSGDYINHAKAMIDMRAGATGSITVATGNWTGWKSLPSHWDGSYTGSVPTSAYIISFVNDLSGSCGTYGEPALSAGFGAQPSVNYQQNYDELLDIVNGTTTTAWGASMNSTQPGWGYPIFGTATDKTKYFAHALIPIVKDSGSSSAAAVLQMAGAVLGELVLRSEFDGLKTGGVQYPINLANHIYAGSTSTPIPYDVNTPVGNTMTGLKEYNYIPAFWLEGGIDLKATNLDLQKCLLSMLALDENYAGYNCTGSTSTGLRMKDSVNNKILYSFGASCAAASNAALHSTNPMAIYNNTGILFDTSAGNRLAYKTQQGCSEAIADDQIAPGWYAVVNGQNNYKVAQYSTGTGWSHGQCCDGVGGCKAC